MGRHEQTPEAFGIGLRDHNIHGDRHYLVQHVDGRCFEVTYDEYFSGFGSLPEYQKLTLRYATGLVLDIGCGAAKHSLALQHLGFGVVALDISRQACLLSRERGIKSVIQADAFMLPIQSGVIDTVLVLGNTLGVCGTVSRLLDFLRVLKRICSPYAFLLLESRNPAHPRIEPHLRPISVARSHLIRTYRHRMRILYENYSTPWFDFLLIAPTYLVELCNAFGFVLYQSVGESKYVVVLRPKH